MERQKQIIGNRTKRINAARAWMAKRMIGHFQLDIRKCLFNDGCITPAPPLSFVGEAHLGQVDFNTLAAPLFRQVKCPRNDVHQGRVPFSNNALFELHRITAAPPLMPFRHNAVLGRLLLFTHSLLGRAASWATKASLNCCGGQSQTRPRIERITRMKRLVTRLVAILRVVTQSANRGIFDLNYLYDSGNGQSASGSRAIPLDFCQDTTDNNAITPVPPLPLVGEVHLGQVFLCPDGKLPRRGGHRE